MCAEPINSPLYYKSPPGCGKSPRRLWKPPRVPKTYEFRSNQWYPCEQRLSSRHPFVSLNVRRNHKFTSILQVTQVPKYLRLPQTSQIHQCFNILYAHFGSWSKATTKNACFQAFSMISCSTRFVLFGLNHVRVCCFPS